MAHTHKATALAAQRERIFWKNQQSDNDGNPHTHLHPDTAIGRKEGVGDIASFWQWAVNHDESFSARACKKKSLEEDV
jgi:hypothetical protein